MTTATEVKLRFQRGGWGVSVDIVEAGLEKLWSSHNQQLTPHLVVDAASDPKSPLHGCFVWDDERAAHGYRLDQARALLRDVQIQYADEEWEPKFVHVVIDKQPFYQKTDIVVKQLDEFRSAVMTFNRQIHTLRESIARLLRVAEREGSRAVKDDVRKLKRLDRMLERAKQIRKRQDF